MPINLCHVGETVVIKKIKGNDATTIHLKELGFVEGTEVKIMNKSGRDVIVQVKDARIALDATMSKRILV